MAIVSWLFEKAEPLLDTVCTKLSTVARSRRCFYTEANPYLTRFYFTKRASRFFGVYLHYLHRGDDDLALHNHPFGWSCTVVLTNGYREDRWDSKARRVTTRKMLPGSISVIRVEDFHRVNLLDKNRGAWTLFISGRRVKQSWILWWPGSVHEFVPAVNFTRSRTRYAGPN